MTDTLLAQNSNYAVYGAMAVLTLAMLAFAAHLAWLLPSRDAEAAEATAAAELSERALVGAGAPVDAASGGGAPSPTVGREAAASEVPLRARKAAGIARTLTWLGTLVLVAGVVLRAASVHRAPLGNMYEFALMGSVFALVAYVAWDLRRPLPWLGLFVVGPVLLILGAAISVWYTEAAQLMPSLKSVWLVIHVAVATLSVGLFTIGFSLGLLYLIQDRVERSERVTFMSRMPSARALERLAYGIHIVAFPLWTFTVIAGAIWARQAWGAYWNWDPKEVWSFVIWVAYAAYLHARATAGWNRRTATWIALAAYGCIIVNYAVVNVFFVSQHSYSGL